MVRQDIVYGLKNAMQKGHSLKEAMQSFYNAGYNKQEVEEAAQHVQGLGNSQVKNQTQVQNTKNKTQKKTKGKKSEKKGFFKKKKKTPAEKNIKEVKNKGVSDYETKPKKKGGFWKILVFGILGIVALALIIAVILLIIYRQPFIDAFF